MSDAVFKSGNSAKGNVRYSLTVSLEDKANLVRGQRWEGIVTDITTGVQYYARAAECELGPECRSAPRREEVRAERLGRARRIAR